MKLTPLNLLLIAALVALAAGTAGATTRELAEFRPLRLSFDQSVLNQLTHETYRDPFDELQTRPYNLLFSNIGRHASLSPWEGQEGGYTRYLNALIGNNGAANVENDADAVQGSMIRRETARLSWGLSAAFLSGTDGSDDTSGSTSFSDSDDLSGIDLRGSTAFQLSERRVLGVGFRANQATREFTEFDFVTGVGGTLGSESFDQQQLSVDAGLRTFTTPTSSWEIQARLGMGAAEQVDLSENLDDTGSVVDRFVIRNYDVSDTSLGVSAGYHRAKAEKLGETAFRLGLERTNRELNNDDLAFSETGGVITPTLTLLDQDTITATRLRFDAQSIFQAGETELFSGAQLGYTMLDGATRVDAAGIVVNETIDDSSMNVGLTVGLRQPLMKDRLRFVVSGRADYVDRETNTAFDTGSDGDNMSLTTAQYAIGLEGVLANVTFDLAWLNGEEAAVEPVPIGISQGSRRSVELNRLIFSAAVSW